MLTVLPPQLYLYNEGHEPRPRQELGELHSPLNYGHSPINVDRVDTRQYPGARLATVVSVFLVFVHVVFLTMQNCSLEVHSVETSPGDVLFIPAEWWHIVRSLDPGQRNLAITFQLNVDNPYLNKEHGQSHFSYHLMSNHFQKDAIMSTIMAHTQATT
jgi:hypothetical protein